MVRPSEANVYLIKRIKRKTTLPTLYNSHAVFSQNDKTITENITTWIVDGKGIISVTASPIDITSPNGQDHDLDQNKLVSVFGNAIR